MRLVLLIGGRMKIVEMLRRGAVVVPLNAPDLQWALTSGLRAIPGVSDEAAKQLGSNLVTGVSGEIHHVHGRVVVALTESDAVADICAVVGVSPAGFAGEGRRAGGSSGVSSGGGDAAADPGLEARSEMVLILVTPRRLDSLRDRTLPSLKRFFREEEKVAPLLNARSADGVGRMSVFMELDPHRSLLVEDVVEPVKYRVYPDTPYSEVADLMVRRELQAVPVVGEDYKFLGVITTGDAMEELVSQARVESVGGNSAVASTDLTARGIMTRTVMCISEEQSLIEAASIMVNRGVEQLPVIREGEMVGLLTRREVLRWLFPDTSSKQED
jgi:CBS domain-containing protein